ncbi:SCO family protein [Winogradskyella sp. UBA3174]|uniref:SCO family protein n=1 Tax=Winogradskyella sp. UBA3174 TaxID=1947785 RepID=UPI0025CFDE16|nr:SCO family protein [Winogradskyella sp. UBA3174]|tara:strand:- start:12905 stop:13660 length:756 start_codon:yes stop_codon:yes gene_type:complete
MSKKTSYSYVGITFIILIFGIIFVPKIIDRFNSGDVTRDGSRSEDVSTAKTSKQTNKSDLAYIEINGTPKKVPTFSFINQDGKMITNEDYLGKVYVVEFFFTTCPTICAPMNRNLVEIQNQFTDFDDFGVASFSIMPKVDTQEVLKEYAENYGVTNPHWNLMTGDRDEIFKLANIGFNIFVGDTQDEFGFEHSGDFALIDKEGFVRSRKDDFGNPKIFYRGFVPEADGEDEDGYVQEITILKEDIAKLLKE